MNIVFFGSPLYSSKVLSYLLSSKHSVKAVITQDIKINKNKKDLKTPVGLFGEKNNLPTLYPDNLNKPKLQEDLKCLNADIFFFAVHRFLTKQYYNLIGQNI